MARGDAGQAADGMGEPAEGSDASLVAAARRGDEEAFARLFQRHWHAVVAVARRILRDHDLAQDAAQEAFVRAHRMLWSLDDGRTVLAWLRRVARNAAVDHLRARRTLPSRPLEEGEEFPAGVGEGNAGGGDEACAEGIELWNALKGLSARDRALLVMRYGRGLGYERIALESGLTVAVVKVALHRGRARLASR